MLGWLTKLSDLHVKTATLFERIDGLATKVEHLSDRVLDLRDKVSKLEGVAAASAPSVLLLQLEQLRTRIDMLERQHNDDNVKLVPGADGSGELPEPE